MYYYATKNQHGQIMEQNSYGKIITVSGVLCEDGVYRNARTKGEGTSLAIPAVVTCKKKTVTGFLIICDAGLWGFIATGEHQDLIKKSR